MNRKRNFAQLVLLVSFWLLIHIDIPQVKAFSGTGSGTPLDPFMITTCTQLQEMSLDLSSAYKLAGDIDCSATTTWNSGLGFVPIVGFGGSLDGANYKITSLTINRPAENWCGLFSDIGSSGPPPNPIFIRDLMLENIAVTCNYGAGGLVSYAYGYAEVSNVDVSGQVIGTGNTVGGIVGTSEGIDAGTYNNVITQSTFTGTVSGTSAVGGIVGEAYSGEISYSTFSGTVTGTTSVGGIVGEAYGQTIITHTNTAGTVSGTGTGVGGLVGLANFSRPSTDKVYIDNSYSTVAVSGPDIVGGLVGGMFAGSRVETSYATGNVSGATLIGGLVGDNDGSYIADSYATGTVTGTGDYVGGITGDNDLATVLRSYSTGNVTGRHLVGGLVGGNNGTIDKSYATGNVSGTNKIGGITGQNDDGTITDSYSNGSATGNRYVGGLVGYLYGDVNRTFSTGAVTGVLDAGGLVGFYYDGVLTNSMYDTNLSGQIDVGKGTPKTTAEMKQLATFSGVWDIGTDTGTIKNNGYPYLSWQEGQATPVWSIYVDTATGTSTTLTTAGAPVSAYCEDINEQVVPSDIIESRRVDADSVFISWGPYSGLNTFNVQYGTENGKWLYNVDVTGFSTTINNLPANTTIWVRIATRSYCTIGDYGTPKLVGGPEPDRSNTDPRSIGDGNPNRHASATISLTTVNNRNKGLVAILLVIVGVLVAISHHFCSFLRSFHEANLQSG